MIRFLEFLPSVQKTPEYLEATGYRNPEDPLFAPLQYTNNMKEDGFSWLCENPDALARFNNFMEGQRADRPHWADWFPVQDRVLANADPNPDRALIVDIGGGRGHDLLGFRKRFPDAPGKLVLEDLPLVIDEVQGAQDLDAARIVPIKYNFFTEQQPVKGESIPFLQEALEGSLRVWRLTRTRPRCPRILLQECDARLVRRQSPHHSQAHCGCDGTRLLQADHGGIHCARPERIGDPRHDGRGGDGVLLWTGAYNTAVDQAVGLGRIARKQVLDARGRRLRGG